MDKWKTFSPAIKRYAIEEVAKKEATDAAKYALYVAYPELVLDSMDPRKGKKMKELTAPTKEDKDKLGAGANFKRGFLSK
jgi:hypothetical protein